MHSIGIVEDHPVFAAALRRLLETDGMTVCFSVSCLSDARSELRLHQPDVVLLDLSLPDGNGLELLTETPEYSMGGRPKFVVLSSADERSLVAEAERAGCSGFISKVAEPLRILAAIRDAAAGKMVFDVKPVSRPVNETPSLSPRELACLALVAEGLSNRAIAVVLGISTETVKSHLEAVRAKLGAIDRAQAVAIGIRLGLI